MLLVYLNALNIKTIAFKILSISLTKMTLLGLLFKITLKSDESDFIYKRPFLYLLTVLE